MCGIAGFSGGFEGALLTRMGDSMAHRGPDDSGTCWIEEAGVGLAHRRLSIIDLSPRGHQPMWDVTGRAAIVYNGELYNYRELRTELLAQGFRFQSDSDTEVLLNLYLRDGEAMVERLNGIFAFAIWDGRDRCLFLARDGVGVKPLYYAETGKGVLFASELKALLQTPAVDRTLDPRAIHDHLLYLWCPAPRTMLRGVKKLEPGHCLRIRDGKVEMRRRFWDLPYSQPIANMTERDAIEEVRAHLAEAVKRQMVADVPVGAFLSGGVDSSTVVSFARQWTGAKTLQCFTIGFTDEVAQKEGMAADLPYAQLVAKHLGVDLHTIYVGPEIIEELPKMVYHLDEPQADLAPINALFISQLAREHDIKVLLSGAGGDDIFTGYRRHWALRQERLWSWLPRPARAGMRRAVAKLSPLNETTRRIAKAFSYADLEPDDRIASYFYWIGPERVRDLCTDGLLAEIDADRSMDALGAAQYFLPEDTDPLNRMLYLEGKFFLADHNLNYTDKVAMASGVEVRVPLLDPDLVALAARLPLDFKQNGRIGKWILRKAMEPDLPHSVLHRSKMGFGAPLRHWLRNELRPFVEDVLSESSLRDRGLFDPKAVQDIMEVNRAGRVDASYTIFAMMCIEVWCRTFVDPTVPRPAA